MNTAATRSDVLWPLFGTFGQANVLETLIERAGRMAGWSLTIAAQPTASTPVDPADQSDIAATLGGDGDAYARLVARHQQRVAAHMWRFTRDPQAYEELVHEVFVEAYLNLRSYRAEAPLVHWLLRIATRVGYRHWKARDARRSTAPLPLCDWDVAARDDPATSRVDAAEQVHQLLAQLPPRDRLVLTLLYVEGYSIDEAARLSGWSRTMTKVQAFRARGRLKKLLSTAE